MNRETKKIVGKFLANWKKKDWAKMAKYTQLTWRDSHKNNAQLLEWWFGIKPLKKWKITDIKIIGDACRDIYIDIDYGEGMKEIRARVICEVAAYEADVKGTWGVNPISCLKEKNN